MDLIIISPPDDVPDETRTVGTLLQQFPVTFHLRKPAYDDAALAVYLQAIPSGLHKRIMVHGHAALLDGFAVGGIHFTENQRLSDLPAIRRLRQQRSACRISSAFHRIADVPASDGLLDYLFLSPIYDSISKQGYRAAFERSDLKSFLDATDQRIVALGGVNGRRIDDAAALGFSGVAVLGAIWAAGHPVRSVRELVDRCRAVAR